MQGSTNRSVAVISGLLTLLVLGGGMGALAFHNGWLRPAAEAGPGAADVRANTSESRSDVVASPLVTETPSTAGAAQDDVEVYRQKLDEAYRALDDAYAQIRSGQTAPARLAANRERGEGFDEPDGDNDRRARRSGRDDWDDD